MSSGSAVRYRDLSHTVAHWWSYSELAQLLLRIVINFFIPYQLAIWQYEKPNCFRNCVTNENCVCRLFARNAQCSLDKLFCIVWWWHSLVLWFETFCHWHVLWMILSQMTLSCSCLLSSVIGRATLVAQRPTAIKLSRGRSVGLWACRSVHAPVVRRFVQCIVEQRLIGSGCRLALWVERVQGWGR